MSGYTSLSHKVGTYTLPNGHIYVRWRAAGNNFNNIFLVSAKNAPIVFFSFHIVLFFVFTFPKTIKKNGLWKLLVRKIYKHLRKNGLHRPGSWAALGAMVGRPKNHENKRPSKSLSESLCRWPANAILRLRKAGAGFECWGLGCGQVGPHQAPGAPKTKKKRFRQKNFKNVAKNLKKTRPNTEKTKNVKTKKNVLIVFGRH